MTAGNLYGASQYGGGHGSCNPESYQYCGTVFELNPPKQKGGKWKEKVLYSFKGVAAGKQVGDGANPNGGLVLDSTGAIYGTTYYGGSVKGECNGGDTGTGCGTAFELIPSAKKGGAWTEKLLHRFDGEDGATPAAGVIFGASGDLYGTAYAGAIEGNGAVFELAPPTGGDGPWREAVIHRFRTGGGGANPEGALMLDKGGSLYGTTSVGSGGSLQGSVFRMRPNGTRGAWTISTLCGFPGPPGGEFPSASLVADKGGNLYSTTKAGGTGSSCQGGCGTVFKISR